MDTNNSSISDSLSNLSLQSSEMGNTSENSVSESNSKPSPPSQSSETGNTSGNSILESNSKPSPPSQSSKTENTSENYTLESYSESFESIEFSDNLETISSTETPDSYSSSETSPLHKTYLLMNDYCKVELFNDHSGEAYIFKEYLDKNPTGETDDSGYIVIGWSVVLCCNEKELAFNITRQSDEFQFRAQYNLNGECQDIYLDYMNVKRKENGDLKIEFDIDEITYDLRDSFSVKITNIIDLALN